MFLSRRTTSVVSTMLLTVGVLTGCSNDKRDNDGLVDCGRVQAGTPAQADCRQLNRDLRQAGDSLAEKAKAIEDWACKPGGPKLDNPDSRAGKELKREVNNLFDRTFEDKLSDEVGDALRSIVRAGCVSG
jgi:hypothetical protein